jgi:hypothetical protein
LSWREIFPHAKIVIDPKKLAQLNSEIEKRDRNISHPDWNARERTLTCRKK